MRQFTILFLVNDDDVLLAMKKRGFGRGKWNGVGGKVEPGETLEQTAQRECKEEIGVIPTSFYKAASIIYNEYINGQSATIHVSAFVGKRWDGSPTETEEMAPQWFPIQKLPYETMWADDPYWLEQVLAGKLLNCEFTLDENEQVTAYKVQEVVTL